MEDREQGTGSIPIPNALPTGTVSGSNCDEVPLWRSKLRNHFTCC